MLYYEDKQLRSRYKIMTNKCFLRCPVWDQSTHHFPNHKKNHDRFKAWVEAIDRKLETDEDYEFFRTKRLCHIHFKQNFLCGSNRLSPTAIPTLYLTKESRDEYWLKDLEIRRSMIRQSKSPPDETPNDVAERSKDKIETSKDEPETYNKDPEMDVPNEKIPSSNLQSSLPSDVQDSLVNLLIKDLLEGKNENDTDDVQKKPNLDLSVPSPVELNVPNPVADIIIEYVPTTEFSKQKLLIQNIPRDTTTTEVVESLPSEPVFIHDLPVDLPFMETSAEEIKINFDSVKKCINLPKKKRKCNYNGITWELGPRIPMEHNYSKASLVAFSSHISSNGTHPKKTIIALKNKVRELRKNLKFYKKRCKDLSFMNPNQQTVTKQIISKKVTKMSQKGQTSHKKAYKIPINYSKIKNVGCGISLRKNI